MILYRPTGVKELELVRDSGWRAWPPRLPDQPIFYPVTTFEYAEKIARDWNSVLPSPDDLGFVTRFEITPSCAAQYPVEQAGGKAHEELWVPAEQLDAFNKELIGTIQVVSAYQNGARLSENAMITLIPS